MTYPLPTLAAQVTASGISAPSYPDVLESLRASFRLIYGADAYLEPDSQDGQLLAVFAAGIHDTNQTAIAVYNGFRPDGATGESLSRIVRINGLARSVATNSTADLRIVGQAGTVIAGGMVNDAEGRHWLLPASVTIPVGGEITVTATAQNAGAITAPANTITRIFTPTRGWQSVTNPAAATPGAPVESDAALRRRQARSVALPAQTVIGAIHAGIAAVDGVTALVVYENDTASTDGNGIPSHSIAAVVEGGDAATIAQEIARRKAPGTGTHGGVSILVPDERGVPATIRFARPTVVPITVEVDITARAGYVDATGTALIQAVADYINAGTIGDDVYLSRLYTPANEAGETYTVTGLRIARGSSSPSAANITIAYNELATCDLADITLTVT